MGPPPVPLGPGLGTWVPVPGPRLLSSLSAGGVVGVVGGWYSSFFSLEQLSQHIAPDFSEIRGEVVGSTKDGFNFQGLGVRT